MRLISAHVRGWGRLVDAKVNLDAKVIAIVGPNEAGKTTLLKALAHVDKGGSVPVAQRSRATDVTDEASIITLDYVLDDEDRAALADLEFAEEPTRATVSRSASGGRLVVAITPQPRKSAESLKAALDVLMTSHSSRELEDQIDPETTYADPASDAARNYRSDLLAVIRATEAAIAEPGSNLPEEAVDMAKSLAAATMEDAEGEDLHGALASVVAWAALESPGQAAGDRIWRRTPDIILFSEPDRSLRSSYTFDDELAAEPPAALANLAGTAGLDLEALRQSVAAGDVARRRTAILKANKQMDAIFADAWKQSHLAVHLELDGDELRVELIEDGNNVTVFDERSAGLRMFVALVAFLRVRGSSRASILLIDEAENHLHIDAQADLVNMFVTQQHAVKVIYTTHSPACLPPDLGTGIRTVVPNTDGSQVSTVENSFWQGAAGYSPLMLAMGAAAAAFTPARNVVLAEGATEMILLPTLLRVATGEVELPYQIAPGLSEVPKDFMPKLDLEGARVAYLVDGDPGGSDLRSSLIAAGVPEGLIVEVAAPGIENLLEANAYRDAVSALLAECNPRVPNSDIPTVPEVGVPAAQSSWASWAEKWIVERKLKAPSKVAIANWLIENQRVETSDYGSAALKAVHLRLLEALR